MFYKFHIQVILLNDVQKGILLIYLYVRNLINYVNAVMPIFLSTISVNNFDLMKSVMSFTAEMIFVGVLLRYHVLITVIHYGIII